MPLEKILQKIQQQIAELQRTLDAFIDDTVQPPVADCDQLRQQMIELYDQLAVYKYHKSMKELSPSFNIHAKVSEKAAPSEPEILKEPVRTENKNSEPEHQPVTTTLKKPNAPLVIGINDKFRFINELFSQNSSEYNIVLEQLSNLSSWHETDIYLNSLKNVYGWKDNAEVVKYFYSLVKKRFD